MWTQFFVERQIIAFEFDRIVLFNARYMLVVTVALNASTTQQALAFTAYIADRTEQQYRQGKKIEVHHCKSFSIFERTEIDCHNSLENYIELFYNCL